MTSPWNHHENPAPSISHENHHNFTHPRIAKAWHCPKPDDFEEYGCYAGAGTVGSTEALFLSEGWCFPREKWWIWWPEKGWKMEKKWRKMWKMVKHGEKMVKNCGKMEVYSWVREHPGTQSWFSSHVMTPRIRGYPLGEVLMSRVFLEPQPGRFNINLFVMFKV